MAKNRRIQAGDPTLAVGYLRVSTDDQHLGPEAQRGAIEAWAAREGRRVVSWHEDRDVSGGSELDDRPGLMAAIVDVRARGAGWLVVAKRDRLARGVEVAVTLEKAVRGAGARVATADGRNEDGPADVLLRRIEDATAEWERAQIRARTRAALGVLRAQGRQVGRVRWGFRVAAEGVRNKEGTRVAQLEPDPAELRTCALIMQLHHAGYRPGRIARELLRRGRDVHTRAGWPLSRVQVTRIIHDAAERDGLLERLGSGPTASYGTGAPALLPADVAPARARCGRGHDHDLEAVGALCTRGVCGEQREDKAPRRIRAT